MSDSTTGPAITTSSVTCDRSELSGVPRTPILMEYPSIHPSHPSRKKNQAFLHSSTIIFWDIIRDISSALTVLLLRVFLLAWLRDWSNVTWYSSWLWILYSLLRKLGEATNSVWTVINQRWVSTCGGKGRCWASFIHRCCYRRFVINRILRLIVDTESSNSQNKNFETLCCAQVSENRKSDSFGERINLFFFSPSRTISYWCDSKRSCRF